MLTAIARGILGLVLAFILLLIFASLGQIPATAVMFTNIVLAAAAVIWGLARLLNLRATRFSTFSFYYLGFILWLVFQAWAQHTGLPGFGSASHWGYRLSLFSAFFSGFLLYFLTQEVMATRKMTVAFIHLLVILSTLFAVYFIIVFFTTPRLLGLPQVPFPILRQFPRWAVTFLQPNNLVDLFIPAVFFGLSLVFYWNTRRLDVENPQKIYGFMLVNLCFTCVLTGAVLFTQSRAGILALFFGLAVYLTFFTFAHRRRGAAVKRLGIFFAVAAVFLASLGMKEVIGELLTIASTVSEESKLQGTRMLTMLANWQVIAKKGFLGVGLGNFEQGWLAVQSDYRGFFPVASYNDFLWMWAETGLPGVILFFGGTLFLIVRSLMTAVKTESYTMSYFLIASACSLVAILVHSLVDTTLYVPPLLWLLLIMAGIATSVNRIDSEKSNPTSKQGQPLLLSLFCILVITAIAAGTFYFNLNKFKAFQMYQFQMYQRSKDPAALRFICKLDPWSPTYPVALADFYTDLYERGAPSEVFEMALEALDRAIEVDPSRISLYPHRARLFLKGGEEKGITQTFEMMEKNMPNFYRAYLAASAFYMNEAVDTSDTARASRFETQAIRRYVRALELYPQFSRETHLFRYASPKAVARYQELAAEKRI